MRDNVGAEQLQQVHHCTTQTGGSEALLRCGRPAHTEAATCRPGSGHQDQIVERDSHPSVGWIVNCQLIVPSPEVLDEGMPGDDHPGAAVPFEPAHRPEPRLEPAVIRFNSVVAIAIGAVPCRWQQPFQHGQVHRRLIGDNLCGNNLCRVDRLLEEPAGGHGVPAGGDEHVDDLPELVDRSVHIPPAPSDPHVRLVYLPAIANQVPARPGSIGQQRREPQHLNCPGIRLCWRIRRALCAIVGPSSRWAG